MEKNPLYLGNKYRNLRKRRKIVYMTYYQKEEKEKKSKCGKMLTFSVE
jgi:hypothetical protein